MRVCLLCHFSNAMVRSRLQLNAKGRSISDFAPWVPTLVSGLSGYRDLELHVIAPYDGLLNIVQSFKADGVTYHFFRCNLPVFNRRIPADFPKWLGGDYSVNRVIVHWLIRKIKPDIINLIGAENAYYSSCILGVKGCPVLVTIQGIYSNPERFKFQKEVKSNSRLEREVHRTNKYFGINASFMPSLIGRDATDPIYFWDRFPVAKGDDRINVVSEDEKKYDFIHFSRLAGTKGVFETIGAMARVVRSHPRALLRMLGPASDEELARIQEHINTLGIQKNVILSGACPAHRDVLQEAVKARISVLPTRIDTIPTTIFESIELGLPVVSCNTGDIPKLNVGKERVLLSDVGDVERLAQNMVRVLESAELRAQLAKDAREFVGRYFGNEANVRQHANILHAVYAHYTAGRQIPKELLYEGYLERRLNAI